VKPETNQTMITVHLKAWNAIVASHLNLNSRDYWVFGFCPLPSILNNTSFGNFVCFRPQVRRGHLLYWVHRKDVRTL
jgi:hypothetical protein